MSVAVDLAYGDWFLLKLIQQNLPDSDFRAFIRSVAFSNNQAIRLSRIVQVTNSSEISEIRICKSTRRGEEKNLKASNRLVGISDGEDIDDKKKMSKPIKKSTVKREGLVPKILDSA